MSANRNVLRQIRRGRADIQRVYISRFSTFVHLSHSTPRDNNDRHYASYIDIKYCRIGTDDAMRIGHKYNFGRTLNKNVVNY